MSQLRRLRQQMALRQRVNMALRRHRLHRVKHYVRMFCMWYFVTWRGVDETEGLETLSEADTVVLRMLLWANAEYLPLRALPHMVREAVAW